jgi:hypothetical protein
MATPTEAEIQTQISKVVDLLEETKKFGADNAENYLALEDAVVQNLEGDYSDQVLAALAGLRASLAGTLTSGTAAAILTPLFLSYAKVRSIPYRTIPEIFRELHDDFVANSKTVNSREITFASMSYSGTGNGVLNRLTEDKDGFDIENATAEAKAAKCVEDEHSGAVEHEEVFRVSGAPAGRDPIEFAGSGKVGRLVAVSARHSARFIRNPSFDDITGSVGSLTGVTGWTPVSDISNFDADETDTYRGYAGAGTLRSLEFTGSDTLEQNLNVASARFDPTVPVYVQCAVMRKSSATGTFTLTFGSKTAMLDVSTISNDTWTVVRLALDKNLFFPNWNQEDPKVSVGMATLATGTVLVDDVIVTPMTFFDGTWWALVGGSTPFLRDGEFTGTDTEVGAKINYWLWRAFGLYLPHTTGGTETWADP